MVNWRGGGKGGICGQDDRAGSLFFLFFLLFDARVEKEGMMSRLCEPRGPLPLFLLSRSVEYISTEWW